VAVSLLLSGALTWVLVRDLEFLSGAEQLDQVAVLERNTILRQECATIPPANQQACPQNRLALPSDYEDRLRAVALGIGVDRLLLLDRHRQVVFDSQAASTVGQAITVKRTRTISQQQVLEAEFSLGPDDYIASGIALNPQRDPLGASFVVFGRSKAGLTALAAQQLLPRLFLAGGVALLLAVTLALLASRAMARPLSELASAAEDVAAGNYSRRVRLDGRDEIGVVGSAFNRMAEAVERARAQQRDFLANVSHELKTPLTSLIGFSQALVDGSLRTEAEKRRAAVVLHEEARRVLRMAQELLDLARVESGQISLHVQAVDLGALLHQELEILRPRARERELTLELTVPAWAPPVKADPERLHQILDNLLDNAVKYAPPSARVSVQVSAEAGEVVTSVLNPVGDHPPNPERMFDRFYRADPSRSAAAGGVGLGLAISRQLAVAQKGRLWADFTDAGDLRLRLALPAAGERRPAQARAS